MTHRAPVSPIAIAVAAVATVVLLGLLGVQLVLAVETLRQRVERSDAVYSLHTEIVAANQAQAFAITLAAETGDVAWVVGHRRAADRLAAGLRRLPPVVADDELLPLVSQAIAARQGMVLGENIATAAIRRGDLERASVALADAAHLDSALAFESELQGILEMSHELVAGAVADGKMAVQTAVWSAVVALAALGAFWGWIVLRASGAARRFAELLADLETAHAELARRAQDREASLFDHSPTPVMERDARPLGAAFASLRARGVVDLAAELLADPGLHRSLYDLAQVTRANEPYLHLLGAGTLEEFHAKRKAALDVADFVYLSGFLTRVWDGAATIDEELVLRTTEPHRVVRTVHRVLRDADGTPATIITSTIDLTPEREMQNDLAAARDAAEAANKAKSEFLATMSHEIRTPMNGVLGMAAALGHTELQPAQRQMLNVIEESGSALMVILNDILDISKIEAGRLDIESTDFDLETLTGAVEALFTPRAAERGLTLSLHMAPESLGVWRSDAARIRQMLANFLSNAIKFTHAGEVRLEVTRVENHPDDPVAQRPYLVFTVTDTGIGIPAERLAALWSPFTQADSSTTRQYGGTGLGLAIVKRLAEEMGGWVAATSAVGAGSAFTFAVAAEPVAAAATRPRTTPDTVSDVPSGGRPATPPEAASVEHTGPQVATGGGGLRILAAEDVAQNRQVLQALLPALDPAVSLTFALTGAEAVDLYEVQAFDVILMDMHMPVMDGLDAVRLIRAREAETGRARTPIIALTANAGDTHVRDAFAAGCDAHVAKPIRPAELFGEILAHVGADHDAEDQDEAAEAHLAA